MCFQFYKPENNKYEYMYNTSLQTLIAEYIFLVTDNWWSYMWRAFQLTLSHSLHNVIWLHRDQCNKINKRTRDGNNLMNMEWRVIQKLSML